MTSRDTNVSALTEARGSLPLIVRLVAVDTALPAARLPLCLTRVEFMRPTLLTIGRADDLALPCSDWFLRLWLVDGSADGSKPPLEFPQPVYLCRRNLLATRQHVSIYICLICLLLRQQ